MMATREDVLGAVREALRERAAVPVELPRVPDFRRGSPDLVSTFVDALTRLQGRTVTEPPDDLRRWVSATFPDARRVCSIASEVAGTVSPADFSDWTAPADLDLTVVRSRLGVAETGSVLVTEQELGVSTIAVLAKHLLVLLDPSDIVENIHLAYQHPALQSAAYAVLLSGPSGSADIGGVTVHPAQGVTTLTVVMAARGAGVNDMHGVPS
jgi:L-lactate dehydrogenase complex protein LldG